MRTKWIAALLLAAFAVLALPTAALAAPASLPALDEVVFGNDFTLAAGQSIEGDLVVIGGSLILEKGSLVTGVAIVVGGDATIDGRVAGDLVVVGGATHLGPQASVGGDVVVPVGAVDIDPSARIQGSTIQDVDFPWGDDGAQWNQVQNNNSYYDGGYGPGGIVREVGRNLFGEFFWLVFRAVAMATVALLLVLFMQPHMRRVADTVIEQPPLAGGIGLAGVVVAGFATIMLAVTVLLIPVAIVVPFVVVVAWAFGWISLGLEVGRRLEDAFKATWSPALQASLGTFTLTFATGAVSWVPCLGWLLGMVVGLAGLGAVILSRFGSQAYRSGSQVAAVAPVAEAKPLPAPRKKATKKTTKKTTPRS